MARFSREKIYAGVGCYHSGNGNFFNRVIKQQNKVVVSDTCDSILRESHVHKYSLTYSHSYFIQN